MTPSAVIIQTPAIDFGTFLGLGQQALGRSPAAAVDASPADYSDTERFLSCLAGLRDQRAPLGLAPHLLAHVSFSVLVAADERDMLNLLQVMGMPFVVADTLSRGVQIAVVTGTLGQWRDAVKAGCSRECSVRPFFNRVMNLFEAARLDVWKDFDRRPLQDHTLYLEHKKR